MPHRQEELGTLEGMEIPDDEHFHNALDLLEAHHAGELSMQDLSDLGDMDPRTLAALAALVSALGDEDADSNGENEEDDGNDDEEEERRYALSAVERWRSYAVGEPPRPGLVLAPSKTNPKVKRWQRASNRPPVHERFQKVKNAVIKGGAAAIKGANALLGAVASLYGSRMLTDYMAKQVPQDIEALRGLLKK